MFQKILPFAASAMDVIPTGRLRSVISTSREAQSRRKTEFLAYILATNRYHHLNYPLQLQHEFEDRDELSFTVETFALLMM